MRTRLMGFMIASFFLLMVTSPSLYAKTVVKNLGYGTAEKTIWRIEANKLEIVERGLFKEGEEIVLPDGWDCRICTQEDVRLEINGKQIALNAGEIFDVQENSKSKGRTTMVYVTEGEVMHWFMHNGKPIGEPILVPKGYVLLGNDCYRSQTMLFEDYISGGAPAAAPALPTSVSGTETAHGSEVG